VDVADEQPRQLVRTGAIVEEHDALSRPAGTRQDVADLETDAEAGARRLRYERVARIEPVEIAPKHGVLGQLRLCRLDIIVQQVRGDYLMSVVAEAIANRTAGGHATTISPHSARQIDSHCGLVVATAVQTQPRKHENTKKTFLYF